MNIHWESPQSYLLLNPSYSKKDQKRFYTILDAAKIWPGHIWLSTSGSSVQKWVGLSKQAILASAKAVNQHLNSNHADLWINALPSFHVGGLGIWVRAYLSGARVCDFKQQSSGKWHAEEFYRLIEQLNGTLTALVPTQLHDLITLGKKAPSSLRAVIIGGGILMSDLYKQAIALGWPVLPSYGLTECASQVATASLDSWRYQNPVLKLLPHIQACEKDGRLCFAGHSLLSTYAYLEDEVVRFVDPKNQGWLMSEDRGIIQNDQLTILGRTDAVLKVGGENVDFNRLENHLQTLRLKLNIKAEVTLIAIPDTRLGYCIYCASNSDSQEKIASLIEQFQQTVLPFERIRKVCLVPHLPRSPLGKILKNDLLHLLSK